MKLVMLFTMSVVLLSTSFVACTHLTAKTAGQTIDDRTIIADIGNKIKKDPRLSFIKIKVDSYKGSVTLSGEVPSKQAELQAVRLAESTGGVVSVRSNLLIAGQTAPTGATEVK
jgi:osmotically-inducible protein OsmY